MDIKELIRQADLVLNNEGDPCDYGCSDNEITEMVEYVRENFPSYPYCVVSDWVWVDINLSAEELKKFEKLGLEPCVIYANKVVDDERRRAFESLRTTFLQNFHKNCIFLSRNTAYILCGPGTRVSIDSSVFVSIFYYWET